MPVMMYHMLIIASIHVEASLPDGQAGLWQTYDNFISQGPNDQ